MKGNDLIYHWFFHFNTYTGEWNAFRREQAPHYLNNSADPNILKSKDINDLIKWISYGKEESKNID